MTKTHFIRHIQKKKRLRNNSEKSVAHTFLRRRHFTVLSLNGCVVISNNRKFCFSVVKTPFSTKFLAKRSRTFFNWYRSLNGFHVSPLKYSIQVCTASGGSVSLMCFNASSSSTSPIGVSDFKIILRESSAFRRIPAFSSSMRPRRPSSIRMHPRNPLDMASFQNDV